MKNQYTIDNLKKFEISNNIKSKLLIQDYYMLKYSGIPYLGVMNHYEFVELNLINNDTMLAFSKNSYLSGRYLGIELSSGYVVEFGLTNGDLDYSKFFNSSLYQFVLANYHFEYFLKKLIGQSLLGSYHTNYDKYAKLFREVILELDERASTNGFWQVKIEDMEMGTF